MLTSSNLLKSIPTQPHTSMHQTEPFISPSVFTINQLSISLTQVLQTLRATGQLQPVLEGVASRYVLEQTFQQRSDLTVSSTELEQAVEQFKQQFDTVQFQSWLLDRAWDEALFREQVEFDLKLAKLKAEIAAPKLLETFMEQKPVLDQVVLSRIVVDRLDLAEELRLMIVEEGASFEQLAREYSLTADAIINGMMGYLSRAEVQKMLGFNPYQEKPQTLLEPIFCEQQWWLIRIEVLLPATLNETVQQQLQEQLFDQWLMGQIQALDIELCLQDVR